MKKIINILSFLTILIFLLISGCITPPICGNGVCEIGENETNCSIETGGDCPPVVQYHSVCQNNSCVQVTGAGVSECSVDANCGIIEVHNNVKKMENYTAKEAFLVSDKNWQAVLSLVPLAVWDGNEDCQKGYGTQSSVCVYPALVFHEEDSNFDVDSTIYFLQLYQPTKLTIIGQVPQGLISLLTGQMPNGSGLLSNQIQTINVSDFVGYWDNYDELVYVDNNYELALLASEYASLINAPLIIKGYNDNVELIGKKIICVGSPTTNCQEKYNLNEIQLKYTQITRTNKILLVNPTDIDSNFVNSISYRDKLTQDMVTIEYPLNLSRTTGKIRETYGKNSLAASFLSAAKKELLVTVNSSNVYDIDALLDRKISELGLNANYLTIVSSPNSIPNSIFDANVSRWGQSVRLWIQADAGVYGDIDGDYYQDLAVGRIFGVTVSDASSYINRALFYDRFTHPNTGLILNDYAQYSIHSQNFLISNLVEEAGLNIDESKSYPVNGYIRYFFDTNKYYNKSIISLEGHGWTSGSSAGFNTSVFREENVYLSNSIVLNQACSTCSFESTILSGNTNDLFCSNLIRRGAIISIGAVDTSAENTPVSVNFLWQLFKGKDAGTAFKDASNVYFVDDSSKYSPYSTLLGDPTLILFSNKNLQETVAVQQEPLIRQTEYYTKKINISTQFQNTIKDFNLVTGADGDTITGLANVTYMPSFIGDNHYKTEVYFLKDSREEVASQVAYLKVFFSFENPQNLQIFDIESARIKKGTGDWIDITENLKTWQLSNLLVQIDNKGKKWVSMSLNLNEASQFISQDTNNVPNVDIQVDFMLR
jgi:hypothetical protein